MAWLWDAASGRPVGELRQEGGVMSVAFAPDNKAVLTGSYDSTATLGRNYWPAYRIAPAARGSGLGCRL